VKRLSISTSIFKRKRPSENRFSNGISKIKRP